MVFQDDSGALQEITYDLTVKGNHMGWTQVPVGSNGFNHSGLALTPLRADFLGKGMNVFYQKDDQTLTSYSGNVSAWTSGTFQSDSGSAKLTK
jgi:hypothetical protein